ncbi:MAG: apolipoprotein N-acyltransferase [Pirellulales bacterium]
MLGSGLMWLPQPPLSWWPLAWLAPIPWLLLVQNRKLTGQWPYGRIGLAGWLFWMLAIHWIRLPHPMNYLAWPVLAAVMGAYLPLFVALARVGVHQLGWPLWLIAPITWTGVEWLRAHLLSGFYMGSLAHTQIVWLPIIQVADLLGEYGVTFLIVLVAACLTQACPAWGRSNEPPAARQRLLVLLPAGIAASLALVYGHLRLDQLSQTTVSAKTHVALIQGNTPADWKGDIQRQKRIMSQYVQLSHEALAQTESEAEIGLSNSNGTTGHHLSARPVDLIVWPETMFRQPLLSTTPDFTPPPGQIHNSQLSSGPSALATLVQQLDTPILVGIDRHVALDGKTRAEKAKAETGDPGIKFESYNSAVMVQRQGKIVGTYDKMHRVMFGEYIPLADWFPVLYQLTPLTGGIQSGRQPAGLELEGVTYAPNICYETVLPHVIRQQVVRLSQLKKKPDVMVNLTNDAWFWGSSELDMHLACGILRSVEMRIPLVIAANGGLSAHIDSRGEVRQVSRRMEAETLMADVDIQDHWSLYLATGDWFAIGCVLCCTVLAIVAKWGTGDR